MHFAVSTQALRDAATQARAAKNNRYIAQLREAETSIRNSHTRMVPTGGAGADREINEQMARIMRTATTYGNQVDAHCDFLIAAATSYESAENALIKQANSLPTAFGWRT